MIFNIITIFPDMFDSYFSESIIGRAREDKMIEINFVNPRDFTQDKHNRVDAPPYGGGPGMVMKAEPTLQAVDSIDCDPNNTGIVIFDTDGDQFSNDAADDLRNRYEECILICGRYEGIDARVPAALCNSSFGCENIHTISIGSYTLTGGELPAMIVVDAITRRIEGVLGDEDSVEERRTASSSVYTRPQTIEYNGDEYAVPDVLLSGDHAKIEEWRENN